VKLQQLLASLPAHSSIPTEGIEINEADKEAFLIRVDLLIENLEKHLADWKSVRNSPGF
jgi:ParB family chromosome partitioning protein